MQNDAEGSYSTFTNRKAALRGSLRHLVIYFQFVPHHRFSTAVVVSERRLGNDGLLEIQKENWTLCAELQRSSC